MKECIRSKTCDVLCEDALCEELLEVSLGCSKFSTVKIARITHLIDAATRAIIASDVIPCIVMSQRLQRVCGEKKNDNTDTDKLN